MVIKPTDHLVACYIKAADTTKCIPQLSDVIIKMPVLTTVSFVSDKLAREPRVNFY